MDLGEDGTREMKRFLEKRGFMAYDPEKHHRRNIRLKGYDYTQPGAYFIAICTHGRECLFGEIIDGEMHLNEAGQIVVQTWQDLPNHGPSVQLDAFVVMPNHVHGIIIITERAGGIGGVQTRPYNHGSRFRRGFRFHRRPRFRRGGFRRGGF